MGCLLIQASPSLFAMATVVNSAHLSAVMRNQNERSPYPSALFNGGWIQSWNNNCRNNNGKKKHQKLMSNFWRIKCARTCKQMHVVALRHIFFRFIFFSALVSLLPAPTYFKSCLDVVVTYEIIMRDPKTKTQHRVVQKPLYLTLTKVQLTDNTHIHTSGQEW